MSNYSFKTVRWTITNLSGYICLGFVSSVDNKLISWSCEGFYLFLPPPKKKNRKKEALVVMFGILGLFHNSEVIKNEHVERNDNC